MEKVQHAMKNNDAKTLNRIVGQMANSLIATTLSTIPDNLSSLLWLALVVCLAVGIWPDAIQANECNSKVTLGLDDHVLVFHQNRRIILLLEKNDFCDCGCVAIEQFDLVEIFEALIALASKSQKTQPVVPTALEKETRETCRSWIKQMGYG